MATFRSTRACENPDVDYPLFDPGEWRGSGHLPISSEIIGAIRFTVSKQVSSKEAFVKVTNILIDHWTNRNVYTKAYKNVHKQFETLYIEFGLIRKIFMKGKPSQVSLERYIKFKENKDNFY